MSIINGSCNIINANAISTESDTEHSYLTYFAKIPFIVDVPKLYMYVATIVIVWPVRPSARIYLCKNCPMELL